MSQATRSSASESPLMPHLDSTCFSSLGTGSEEGIEDIPPPTSSPLAARLSAAAAATHLSNPYPADNPPVPKSNAAHSSTLSSGALISAQLHYALGKELTENTLHTHSKFLERLLPHERLPFPVNEELLRKLSTPVGVANAPIWNGLRSCFHRPPMIDFGEAAVCEWLNNIGMTMGLVYGRQRERVWWSGRCRVPLVTSLTQQKPDLVLLDRNYYDKLSQNGFAGTGWAFVKAVAEVDQPNAQLTETTGTRSYLTFLCQPHRRFTILLSFFDPKNSQFSVTVMDRVGQIRVAHLDLMGSSVENGLLLLSILAFLMFGSPEDIGLDPHFEVNLNGHIVAVECENRRFEVLKRIHALPTLFGRGTQVWVVNHNGIGYIAKDCWVREDRNNNEASLLRRMTTHEELKGRIPTLICGGDVVINGSNDSTERYRSARCTYRIHRRIVTSPIGQPITYFKTKKELIRVLMSIIETHRYLHDHVGILHCDLSVNNILLNRRDNESEAVGLLIDFDHSVDTKAANHQGPQHTVTRDCAPDASDMRAAADDTGHVAAGGIPAVSEPKVRPTRRAGTLPFMSIEALLAINPIFVHKPQHDLESILYIIFYICTLFRGPGLSLVQHDVSPPLRTWFVSDNDPREIGYRKLAHVECYDIAILPYFTPYWCDFAPFVKDLIVACFPVKASLPNNLQYDQVLRILKTAYDSVGEPQMGTSEVLGAQCLTQTLKRVSNESSDRDSKKGRHL